MAELKAGTAALGDQLTRARTQLLAFVGVSWATQQVTQLVQVADQWNLMVARLKLATAGQREFVIAQGELFAIAQRIGVPLAEVSNCSEKRGPRSPYPSDPAHLDRRPCHSDSDRIWARWSGGWIGSDWVRAGGLRGFGGGGAAG